MFIVIVHNNWIYGCQQLKMQVSWNGTPCRLVSSYGSFEGTVSLLHYWTLKMDSQRSFETAITVSS